MNYFVKRGDQEYGPYTLAVLQQYVAQGNISKDDLARSEALPDWVPVSSIIGNVTVSAAPVTTGFGVTNPIPVDRPLPPNLHWGVVVVLGIITFGIFWVVWLFVLAVWVRRVVPKSRALFYLLAYVILAIIAVSLEGSAVAGLMQLGGMVLSLMGIFAMRSDIEEYYATLNPAGLSLSGVMTFFFNAAYFQYHMKEIRQLSENPAAAASAAGGLGI